MDYETLKEHWSEVEDRDGVRLSWNVFPTSRMVSTQNHITRHMAKGFEGGVAACGTHRRFVHAAERETRHSFTAIRARDVQAALPVCFEPVLVRLEAQTYPMLRGETTFARRFQSRHLAHLNTVKSMCEPGFGSARSVCREINFPPITRTLPRMPFLPNCTRATRQLNTDFLDLHPRRRFFSTLWTCVRRRIV